MPINFQHGDMGRAPRFAALTVRGLRHMRVLITGGAGFIGSAVCRYLVRSTGVFVINVDKLTYAANPRSLDEIVHDPRYVFQHADIGDRDTMDAVFARYQPNAVIH